MTAVAGTTMSSCRKMKALISGRFLFLPSSRLQPDALSFLRQVLPEVQLDELQNLHGHVGLIYHGAVEGQMPPIIHLAVNDRKEDVREVENPPSAFLLDYSITLSSED